jgi:hypothetical protein
VPCRHSLAASGVGIRIDSAVATLCCAANTRIPYAKPMPAAMQAEKRGTAAICGVGCRLRVSSAMASLGMAL